MVNQPPPNTYKIDKPCIIIEFDPEQGRIQLMCKPQDTAVCSMLLTWLNGNLPQQIFGKGEKRKVIPFTGAIPPFPKA